MTTQAQTPEERLSKLEGAYEQANERLNDLRTDMNERFNELAQAVREGDAALREEIRQGDAALREEIRQVDSNLREEIRQVDSNLREVETSLRASQEAFRSEVHAAFQRQTYLIIGSLGAMWASMVGGFIALILAM